MLLQLADIAEKDSQELKHCTQIRSYFLFLYKHHLTIDKR